jgi:hypothetical protein
MAHVGTFVEAVSQGCVKLGRQDRHVVGKMSSGSGREGVDGSGDILDGEFDHPVMLTIMTRQRQVWGSHHPCKMVFPSRVTLQPVLWKNTLHPALHRTPTDRR